MGKDSKKIQEKDSIRNYKQFNTCSLDLFTKKPKPKSEVFTNFLTKFYLYLLFYFSSITITLVNKIRENSEFVVSEMVAGSGEQEDTRNKTKNLRHFFGEKECCELHYFKSTQLPFKA